MEAAKETLGESKAGKYLEKETWWWNEEVQEAVRNKKQAFRLWSKSRSDEDKQEYVRLNTISKEKYAIAKEQGYEELYNDFEVYGLKRIKDLQTGNIPTKESKGHWQAVFCTERGRRSPRR
eukprot:gene10282-11342_t